MRKIEQQMNEAIRFCRNWSSGNTTVYTEDDHSNVFLHGNLIAQVSRLGVKLFDGGWQTNTTKSRLNAILAEFFDPYVYVYQEDFKWYVCDYSVTQPFTNGTFISVSN